jgi:hypothetical protein
MDDGTTIILELLADRSDEVGPRVQPLPTVGNISALNVPFSSMVIDLHDSTEITAELLGGDGTAKETIRYANIVSFVCLKAMALEGRVERKDPHDLVYCIEHAKGGIEAAAAAFREQMEGKHREAVHQCIGILKKHFVTDEKTEGYLKDGPTMVANFELGESGTRKPESCGRETSPMSSSYSSSPWNCSKRTFLPLCDRSMTKPIDIHDPASWPSNIYRTVAGWAQKCTDKIYRRSSLAYRA